MVLLFTLALAAAPKPIEDPNVLAKKYLGALADGHDQSGKDYLFGGLTLDAVTARVLNPEIIATGAKRVEDSTFEEAAKYVVALDKIGAPLGLESITVDQAKKLTEKTKADRKAMQKKLPLFAD